ncbi:MAG: SigE family RNA polymerase sigma factor [Mycobacteriaceae bacterium]
MRARVEGNSMGERHGDFAEYAAARWPSLVRTAVFLGCRPDDAQDLVQTTLVKCFVAWSKVTRADDRDAYVYRMLLNALRDGRRRHWTRELPVHVPPESAVPDLAAAVDLAVSVDRALGRLSAEHRQVLTLRFLAGLSEQQTATALGVPVGTVKSRASRALALLASDGTLSDLREGI